MNTTLITLILALSSGTNMQNIQTAQPALLNDGTILNDIDGTIAGPDSNDAWFFELDSEITNNQIVIEAGTKLRLLPSATLEKIIADANERAVKLYNLKVRVTKYKGRNFLFPFYYLPISATQTSEQIIPDETASVIKSVHDPNLNDANDILSIPSEVLEKIEAAKKKMALSGRRVSEGSRVPIGEAKTVIGHRNLPITDSYLIDRTALLTRRQNGEYSFVLDAFGRNAPQVRFRLLPCEMLELTELKQSAELEPMRFKITGIKTKYKSNNYLLLQKATRIYSQGNFGI
jgi:hypothetical protein